MKMTLKQFAALHILLCVFSLTTVCGKLAAMQSFMSGKFLIFYMLQILFLGIYALAWQQIMKVVSLTTAYANKAVTVVWGVLWGMLFFGEGLTWGKIAGAILIISGIIIFAATKRGSEHD